MKVLLLDPNESSRDELRRAFAALGCSVRGFGSVGEGEKTLFEFEPLIVVVGADAALDARVYARLGAPGPNALRARRRGCARPRRRGDGRGRGRLSLAPGLAGTRHATLRRRERAPRARGGRRADAPPARPRGNARRAARPFAALDLGARRARAGRPEQCLGPDDGRVRHGEGRGVAGPAPSLAPGRRPVRVHLGGRVARPCDPAGGRRHAVPRKRRGHVHGLPGNAPRAPRERPPHPLRGGARRGPARRARGRTAAAPPLRGPLRERRPPSAAARARWGRGDSPRPFPRGSRPGAVVRDRRPRRALARTTGPAIPTS